MSSRRRVARFDLGLEECEVSLRLHAMLTAVWLGGYVMLLSKARSFFEKPAVRRGMDRVTGTVLIGFGLQVATTQP